MNEAQPTRMMKRLRRAERAIVGLSVLLVIATSVAAAGPLADLVCRSILVKDAAGKTMVAIHENGDVEVGGTLKVRGQQVSSDSPVGSVVPFAGDWPPFRDRDKNDRLAESDLGWMLCDGRAIEKSKYPELFNAIGFANGNPMNIGTRFNLPDYRGRFLRGVDDTANRDSDKDTRGAMFEYGYSGNRVGSVQEDTIALHDHILGNRMTVRALEPDGEFEVSTNPKWADHGTHSTGKTGGAETRPKNVYVNWIIRFR